MKKILTIVVLLAFSAFVYGQCTLRPRATFVTYAPAVSYAPAVTYAPATDYRYKEQIILVPKAIEVEVQRRHYYSIDPYAQQNLLADAIVGRLLRLQARVPEVPAPARTPEAPASTRTPETPIRSGAGTYQNADLLKVVNDSCVKCHGVASKYTPLITSDGKLPDLPAGKIWECFGLVNSGEMPKGGKSLEDNQVKLFYDWAKNARK